LKIALIESKNIIDTQGITLSGEIDNIGYDYDVFNEYNITTLFNEISKTPEKYDLIILSSWTSTDIELERFSNLLNMYVEQGGGLAVYKQPIKFDYSEILWLPTNMKVIIGQEKFDVNEMNLNQSLEILNEPYTINDEYINSIWNFSNPHFFVWSQERLYQVNDSIQTLETLQSSVHILSPQIEFGSENTLNVSFVLSEDIDIKNTVFLGIYTNETNQVWNTTIWSSLPQSSITGGYIHFIPRGRSYSSDRLTLLRNEFNEDFINGPYRIHSNLYYGDSEFLRIVIGKDRESNWDEYDYKIDIEVNQK
jgi:hypothetical protein